MGKCDIEIWYKKRKKIEASNIVWEFQYLICSFAKTFSMIEKWSLKSLSGKGNWHTHIAMIDSRSNGFDSWFSFESYILWFPIKSFFYPGQNLRNKLLNFWYKKATIYFEDVLILIKNNTSWPNRVFLFKKSQSSHSF